MAIRMTVEEYMKDQGFTSMYAGDNILEFYYESPEQVDNMPIKGERWDRNDNHASFGITFMGHDYEFSTSMLA